jgi:hypothetical protein
MPMVLFLEPRVCLLLPAGLPAHPAGHHRGRRRQLHRSPLHRCGRGLQRQLRLGSLAGAGSLTSKRVCCHCLIT